MREEANYFEMFVFLHNSVIYVSLLLCLCILIECLCIFIVTYVLYSVSLCCFVYCLCVNVYLQLPQGLNPTEVNKTCEYQYINMHIHTSKHTCTRTSPHLQRPNTHAHKHHYFFEQRILYPQPRRYTHNKQHQVSPLD